ncbi:MAG: site-2 protease family protein [Bacteroidales bacterium]|jgi:Zn-dependent protease|nr:site-2 protease family protein [Bacteroidales bacterium]
MDFPDLSRMLKFLPGIITGLTVHEFSHAYMAKRCGDLTSEAQGRISLNPMKHIDMLGFIMLLVAGFGWAKPVEFNEANLRNPRKDIIRIAISGPASNALLAMFLSVVFAAIMHFTEGNYSSGIYLTKEVFLYAIYINWGLFIFNMIPLPPLDGSHLLLNYFRRFPSLYEGLYKYGSWIFLGLILVTVFTSINLLPIWPAVEFLGNGFLSVIGYR